jgi:hypothetical protein
MSRGEATTQQKALIQGENKWDMRNTEIKLTIGASH